MFWSPAVTTLSVCAPAPAGSASAAAIEPNANNERSFIVTSQESTATWKQHERLARNHDVGRRAFRDAFRRLDPDFGVVSAHAVAIPVADVHRLRDDARQHQCIG